MQYFLSTVLAGLILLSGSIKLNLTTWLIPEITALPVISDFFKSSPSGNLGLKDHQLSHCPSSANCVNSQETDSTHSIKPLVYQTDLKKARETLLKVLSVVPRTQVIQETDNYILAQSTSRIFGFVDDLEFYFPAEEKVIEIRSASRVGESDLGVNRRRLEQIRLALKDLGI